MVKVFLNVSLEEQKSRFLKRIEDPTRHWKFAAGDLEERQYFAEYHRIYEEVIEKRERKNVPGTSFRRTRSGLQGICFRKL